MVASAGATSALGVGVSELSEAHVAAGVIPRFHDMVRTHPHRVAAIDATRRVTYAGLARQAALVRAAVRATPGSGPVGLLHGHDSGAMGAILGILASGRPLVVLDPATPAPRLRLLLSRARAGACVTDTVHADLATSAAPRTIVADRLVPAADTLDQFWSAPPDPTRPAVLAFTSGTTGRPKIVTNSHRMLVRDAWANSVATGCYGAGDNVAHALPIAFHAGLMAAVAGVLVGATLRFHDPRSGDAHALVGWLRTSQATVAHLSPATARAIAAARPAPARPESLRAVTIAGEPLYGHDAEQFRSLLPPECVIHHRYGSSETGLIAGEPLYRDRPPVLGAQPVGHAVPGRRIRLVGPQGVPVPGDGPGIVTVTGPDLGSGYWDDPEATEAAFTRNADGTMTFRTSDIGRFDEVGRLHLLGRADFSVKIGEYLVEPGEVDSALSELPGVAETVTVGVTPADGAAHLAAYVVLQPSPDPADPSSDLDRAEALRKALREVVPPYMVPGTIVFLDALPRTERGKIDRSALPEPGRP